MEDFSRSRFTAILSDLHLCEEEPTNAKFPLWKKYKSKQFFFDEEFAQFLNHIQTQARPDFIELILNGDIFDFDSVSSIPADPPFRISSLEHKRGLHPQEEKSVYKIEKILSDHPVWTKSLSEFIKNRNRVIFVIGNHDLELHFSAVQRKIIEHLDLPPEVRGGIRFNEWFYISNNDTLVEHGNQYDPYCMAQDPVSPFLVRYNRIEVRVPFGNLTTRYLINGMGFFNPHVDSNFIMSASEYAKFFLKYVIRAQPLLILDWLWGSSITLFQSFVDRLRPPVKDPLRIEDQIENIAKKANATPRMVRELKELFVPPASSYPLIIARELWLDRAFIVFITFLVLFQIIWFIKMYFAVSFYWMFIPLFAFLPFFIFYSKSITSGVFEFKEPQERILAASSFITKVNRIVYGHTHNPRHEIIGAVEHLNSGTWSPAFTDVECTKLNNAKTFVWVAPGFDGKRTAKLLEFEKGMARDFRPKSLLAQRSRK